MAEQRLGHAGEGHAVKRIWAGTILIILACVLGVLAMIFTSVPVGIAAGAVFVVGAVLAVVSGIMEAVE
jgi:hypothetical protein